MSLASRSTTPVLLSPGLFKIGLIVLSLSSGCSKIKQIVTFCWIIFLPFQPPDWAHHKIW